MKKMTTIKLQEKTKQQLKKHKRVDESFDATVQRLMDKRTLERELARGYIDNHETDRKLAKEIEGTLGDGL